MPFQSCKRLNSVSTSLSVWRKQYAALKALNPSAPPLESPLEQYSSFELETVVLQRGSVDAGWHSPREDPVSMRVIPFKNADQVKTCLVDGGRWLLASNFGAVMVYDLDNPKDCGTLLIPRYALAHDNQPTTDLNVNILINTSTLAFNLSISQDRRDAGIFAVKLSATTSYARMVHTIEDEEDITDVLVGARRVYIRSYEFAETFSYHVEQDAGSDNGYCTTPLQERFITKECISHLGPQMDDVSGRIAMAVSSYAIGVFYYSQFDKHKLFMD
ncbi:hypothetical protein HWV62_21669 [Athelia sp. TMB]|nr:hypothetical protein HWV62_21669 [Athelia sp. TMB]